MLVPRFIVAVEWMRFAFRALETIAKAEAEALPEVYAEIIDKTPADLNDIKSWINELCRLFDIKPSQLAMNAGLSPSTINRFLKPDNKTASLNAKTLLAIKKAASARAIELLDEDPIRLREVQDAEAEKSYYNKQNLYFNDLVEVPVLGGLMFNHTRPLDTFQNEMKLSYKMVIPRPENHKSSFVFGFETWDARSPDDIVPGKEVIFCIPAWFDEIELVGNERVIIVGRPHDETISVGIRDLTTDDRGNIWLMPIDKEIDVTEPAFWARGKVPLVKDKTGIALLVVGSYRSLEGP